MSSEMWIVVAILFSAILLFVTEWLRVDIVAFGVLILLMISGILPVQEALSGFSNPAVLTIASLFIVGGGVLQTGLAGIIGKQILKIAGDSEWRLTLLIMLTVALLSSFMSDTGTVAVLLPAVMILARGASLSPSKLLIPLSFGSLLGGASTLIGTPPNIIVNNLLIEEGLQSFSFFSFTPMGVVLIITGIGFMLIVGRKLLPDRQIIQKGQRVATAEDLFEIYRLPDNLYRLRVRLNSPLTGRTILSADLRGEYELSILGILREDEGRPLLSLGELRLVLESKHDELLHPAPDLIFRPNDTLIVQGDHDDISHAAASLNLALQPANIDEEAGVINEELGIAEVLLPPRSSLLGKTLTDLHFGSRYHLTVLRISPPDQRQVTELKSEKLTFGDILLVQGTWKSILALKDKRRDFVVMGEPESMLGAPNRDKATRALFVLLGMLVLIISGVIPVTTASMLAALAMVLSGCLSMDEAYQVVDWRSIVLVAGMLPMSLALEKVELISLVSENLTNALGSLGPTAVMAGLYLITSIFTQVISNTATAVLVAPVALAAAGNMGVHPHAFLMAVAIAASMAFASPVASPVNTLVMSAGQYRFGDYIRIGVPLILILLVVTLIGLPLIWPFY
jgi:di/tricarboxylate transporter